MIPTVNVPFFDGKGETLSNYAQGVDLRNRATNLDPITRVSALILQMYPVSREVCMAAARNRIMDPDSVAKLLQALHDYFAPEAVDSEYQDEYP